jgi:MFS family permease
VGYGWLNAGWGIGAFLSVLYAAQVIRRLDSRRTVAISMALLAGSIFLAPYSRLLAAAVALYALMGSARGVGGIAISSSMMEHVPQRFMGRVQNAFYFAGTVLQVCLSLIVGAAAHHVGLALGFALIAGVYLVAFLTAAWPLETGPALAPGEATGD